MASEDKTNTPLPSTDTQQTEEDVASDPELEELLDRSLGEFGTHVPPEKESSPPPKSKATPTLPPSAEAEFSEIFSEEFAAQAEAQLGEAMRMMQTENPELWKQFEDFSKNLEGMASEAASNLEGVASHGESSVDEGSESKGSNQRAESLAGVLDETLRRMKENAAELGAGSNDQMGDDDELLRMMQGMMTSLLSKDVLYPSLVELCKQYPDWLREHKTKISTEDYQRYSKQLEIMTTICREFESHSGEPPKASSDKILSLMQQLQQCGQPPAELSPPEAEGAGLLPPGGDINPQNCSLM